MRSQELIRLHERLDAIWEELGQISSDLGAVGRSDLTDARGDIAAALVAVKSAIGNAVVWEQKDAGD